MTFFVILLSTYFLALSLSLFSSYPDFPLLPSCLLSSFSCHHVLLLCSFTFLSLPRGFSPLHRPSLLFLTGFLSITFSRSIPFTHFHHLTPLPFSSPTCSSSKWIHLFIFSWLSSTPRLSFPNILPSTSSHPYKEKQQQSLLTHLGKQKHVTHTQMHTHICAQTHWNTAATTLLRDKKRNYMIHEWKNRRGVTSRPPLWFTYLHKLNETLTNQKESEVWGSNGRSRQP